MKKGGCWIFLTHSSADILKVRFIRNEFEKHGQNPLAFHLRCLTTDTPEGRKELDDLIMREIDAREWFVFCESPAAEESEFVQLEKSYIHRTGRKKVWSLDMSLSEEELAEKVAEICRLIKVFVSYPSTVESNAMELIEALIQRDYDVWCTSDFDDDQEASLRNALDSIAKGGFFVSFMTPEYQRSECAMRELNAAIESKCKVVILLLDGAVMPEELQRNHFYSIPHMPAPEDMPLIVDLIEADLKRVIKGIVSLQADAWNKLAKIYESINYEKRYHSQEAECIHCFGASDDYCELYRFPCCGRTVIVGDGPISRFRADGCCKDE